MRSCSIAKEERRIANYYKKKQNLKAGDKVIYNKKLATIFQIDENNDLWLDDGAGQYNIYTIADRKYIDLPTFEESIQTNELYAKFMIAFRRKAYWKAFEKGLKMEYTKVINEIKKAEKEYNKAKNLVENSKYKLHYIAVTAGTLQGYRDALFATIPEEYLTENQ